MDVINLIAPYAFWGIMIPLGFFSIYLCFMNVINLLKKIEAEEYNHSQDTVKDSIWVVVRIFFILLFYSLVFTGSWTLKQSITVKANRYENSAQKNELKDIQEYQPKSTEERQTSKNELEENRDVEPHNNVVSDFDKAMQLEKNNILNRNNIEE